MIKWGLKLAVGLMIATTAQAETWVMPNNGNGEITLTGNRCKFDGGAYPSLRHAYTWTTSMYMEGCWALIDGNVHITWENPNNGTRTRRVYRPEDFNKKGTY